MGEIHDSRLYLLDRFHGVERRLHPLQVCHLPRQGRHRRPLQRHLRTPALNSPPGRRHTAQRAYLGKQGDDLTRLQRRAPLEARLQSGEYRSPDQRGARSRHHNADRMEGRLRLRRPYVRIRNFPHRGRPHRRQHQSRHLPREVRIRDLGRLRRRAFRGDIQRRQRGA